MSQQFNKVAGAVLAEGRTAPAPNKPKRTFWQWYKWNAWGRYGLKLDTPERVTAAIHNGAAGLAFIAAANVLILALGIMDPGIGGTYALFYGTLAWFATTKKSRIAMSIGLVAFTLDKFAGL